MIFWTGWGILAGLIWAAGLFLTQFIVDRAHGPGYYTAHEWTKILATSITAPVIWVVGRLMNGGPDSDKRMYGPRHTLLFIAMEYWGPIFVAIGVLFVLIRRGN